MRCSAILGVLLVTDRGSVTRERPRSQLRRAFVFTTETQRHRGGRRNLGEGPPSSACGVRWRHFTTSVHATEHRATAFAEACPTITVESGGSPYGFARLAVARRHRTPHALLGHPRRSCGSGPRDCNPLVRLRVHG